MSPRDETLPRGAPVPADTMDRVQALVISDRIIDALNVLYDAVDDALWFGDEAQSWPDVEALLLDPRWENFNLEMLVGALVITLPVRGQLGDARPRIIRLIKASDSPDVCYELLLAGLGEP